MRLLVTSYRSAVTRGKAFDFFGRQCGFKHRVDLDQIGLPHRSALERNVFGMPVAAAKRPGGSLSRRLLTTGHRETYHRQPPAAMVRIRRRERTASRMAAILLGSIALLATAAIAQVMT